MARFGKYWGSIAHVPDVSSDSTTGAILRLLDDWMIE
jgi:hypothetical protein